MSVFHLDYETRSKADLTEVGAYRYAEDPSTEILLAAISEGSGPEYLWVNPKHETLLFQSDPEARSLLTRAFTEPDALIYAHNAQFERAVTMYRAQQDLGLAAPEPHQWRCTAAMARKAALHDSLEGIGKDLGLDTQKDKNGKALIRLFSIPDPKTGEFTGPAEQPDKFREFGDYCKTDVKVEKLVHQKLKAFELRGISLDTFLLDIDINDRGIPVNVKALENAKRIIDEFQSDQVLEFSALTGLNPTQRQKVEDMLATLGVEMPDMRQPTLEAAVEKLTEEQPDSVALQILRGYSELNYAAARKVHTILQCVNTDGRVRGTLLYHGAGTGRWAGRLIQPQNFKKPTIKNTELAYKMICEGCTREELQLVFGNPMEVIASCIRHFIHDPEGPILDADYAQIEARIVCWLAGQLDALDDFAAGVDQYKKMAADIYGIPAGSIQNPSKERDLGKQAVLGCGFQMAWKKFKSTCAKYKIDISDELAQKAVEKYRERFDMVRKLWYDTDKAARNAIANPGKSFKAGPKLSFIVRRVADIPFLCMTLPSQRVIVYPHPKIEVTEDSDPERPSITFYGNIKNNLWGRVKTYGGKLVENAVQGTAADVMSIGAQNALRARFLILTLIHDQALGRPRHGKTNLIEEIKIYTDCLKDIPNWAIGCPITAEGKIVQFYKK